MRRLLLLVLLLVSTPATAQVYQINGGNDPLPPTSYNVDRGTPVTGNLAAITTRDGTVLQVTELAGADPLRVTFTFTGVSRFTHVSLFGRYEGSPTHEFHVEVYNVGLTTWDPLYPEVVSDVDNRWYALGVGAFGQYINGSTVLVRFRHITSGIATHNLYLDAIALVQ